MDLVFLFLKLIFALAVVLGLMYLTFKLSGDKLSKINSNKHIKVLERSQISREASIAVVKVGDKGYILSISNNKIEKLDELSKEDILIIEEDKIRDKEKINEQYNTALLGFKSKINSFKRKNN
ncbi:MAG: FliO/MopB family protein [Clostridium sp.]|uniref:FliO/MopB family protein n=1 Tax=Clostridium sp. TaxID=1506 RepID=UPI0025B83E1B|nr:flagellar biosynthetic protein FliO [Clostridium sp.]MCF0148165.1 FliO/MopB family protein [Clostridium sp.]